MSGKLPRVFVLLCLSILFAASAVAGTKAFPKDKVATQLGLNFGGQSSNLPNEFKFKVEHPAKLAAFGYSGLHSNDTGTLKVLSETKFKIVVGGVTKPFVLDDGKVKLGGDEAD